MTYDLCMYIYIGNDIQYYKYSLFVYYIDYKPRLDSICILLTEYFIPLYLYGFPTYFYHLMFTNY